MKLSVVVITKNEEENIRECLESVKFADEIVIVDDFSIDNTVSICREYTDKIYTRELDGFAKQKQFGVDRAKGEWILVLDADERLTPELQKEILATLSRDSDYAGFKILRKSFYLGSWIRHCDWYVAILRLFRKDKGWFDSRLVHENIHVSATIGTLRHPMLHYS
ncbi:MAG: glycosyltransferase family 2 protein, partial [Candidatus Omnitrophica bacterium]|nr:glycosyltransferase family 2 protein [Candidatus Omnitrophota bacterium]